MFCKRTGIDVRITYEYETLTPVPADRWYIMLYHWKQISIQNGMYAHTPHIINIFTSVILQNPECKWEFKFQNL